MKIDCGQWHWLFTEKQFLLLICSCFSMLIFFKVKKQRLSCFSGMQINQMRELISRLWEIHKHKLNDKRVFLGFFLIRNTPKKVPKGAMRSNTNAVHRFCVSNCSSNSDSSIGFIFSYQLIASCHAVGFLFVPFYCFVICQSTINKTL